MVQNMRPFSCSSQDAIAEINRFTPTYRKDIAHMANACRLTLYELGPRVERPLSEYNKRLTGGAVEIHCGAHKSFVIF